MAMAQWRLLRLYHVEAAFLTLRVEDLDYDDPPSIEYQLADIIEVTAAAAVFARISPASKPASSAHSTRLYGSSNTSAPPTPQKW